MAAPIIAELPDSSVVPPAVTVHCPVRYRGPHTDAFVFPERTDNILDIPLKARPLRDRTTRCPGAAQREL